MKTTGTVFLGFMIAFLAGGVAFPQQRVAGIDVVGEIPLSEPIEGRALEPHWGTVDQSLSIQLASGFSPINSSTTYSNFEGNLFRTGGLEYWDHTLDLPAGAEITMLEIEGCDEDPTARIEVFLFRFVSPGDIAALLATAATTDVEAPGCVFRGVTVVAPQRFVDKLNYRYIVRIGITGTTFATRVGAVRVWYTLRVSPPPGSATFTDVPTTHPLFQYVEALAASGITAGCGGGEFCPNAPLTRGQMAVFLSKALGLHFPN